MEWLNTFELNETLTGSDGKALLYLRGRLKKLVQISYTLARHAAKLEGV
jgi:hypothetical protein